MSTRRIPLCVSNKRAYVWDVDDITSLRSKHRICGVLAGTLPHLSQQNVFLGIPLVLMPEEVVLLVEEEIACIVDDSAAHVYPPPSVLSEWASEQLHDVAQQLEALKLKAEKDEKAKGKAMSEEALRKRREREERRAAKMKLKAGEGGGDEPGSLFADTDPDVAPTAAPNPPPDPATKTAAVLPSYQVTIPASSSALPWYSSTSPENSPTYLTLALALDAGVWTYPSTPAERTQCAVFRDLWTQGLFMGGGIKFGGDWLVYPGDPLRYHSHFVATTHTPHAVLRPMEIVAHGRLGTATKKAHLLCVHDSAPQPESQNSTTESNGDRGTVRYLSIEWAGFG